MSIGANILAPWVDDRARMYHWLAQAKPQAVVVCDEPSVAAQVKASTPATRVFHRWVRTGDDSYTNWTVQEWARDFLLPLPPGVGGYLLNEPGGDLRALSAYLVQVMSIAAMRNTPLVVANFSKGNPSRAAIDAGEIDELLLAFNDFPLHWLGYHPYFKDDPETDKHALWHVHFQRRAARIGARVRLLATEAGRDERGAYSDGYHMHMTSPVFAEKLTRQARILKRDGVSMTPFAYGKGGPIRIGVEERHHWEQFDFQHDDVVLNAIIDYNAQATGNSEDDAMAVPGYARVKTGPRGVNVRPGPGLKYAPVAVAMTGDWAKRLPGGTVKADGYTWAQIALDKDAASHAHGWVATEYIELG